MEKELLNSLVKKRRTREKKLFSKKKNKAFKKGKEVASTNAEVD